MKRIFLIGFLTVLVLSFFTGQESYAQVDSRNQTRPEKEQSTKDPDKKKIKTKRIKSKKKLREKGKKIYSNKKQLKNNQRAKAKNVDKSPKGDITGKRITQPKRQDREKRTYPQPDPYKNRRIRTERSRAGPDAPEVRSITKRGERARTGDISGQRKVRQRSVKSAQSRPYPQPNPYVGRKIRTEKERAKSNKKQIRSIRTATRSSESRKPATRSAPVSATASPKVRKRRNIYRGKARMGGEKSTNRDIAGRKIRTKNTRSAVQITGGKQFSTADPYWAEGSKGEGERFKRSKALPASARSISRNSESASTRRNRQFGQHRNRRSVQYKGVVSARRVRSTANPERKGEQPIYNNRKYGPRPVRSASGYSYANRKRAGGAPISVSGRRKQYRQRNAYRGKDKHFGENSTAKDIAGRRLRTRNSRSFSPTWAEFTGGVYGTGSAYKPTKKYATAGGRRQTKAGWNNGGQPLKSKGPYISSWFAARHTGNMPMNKMPGYGPSQTGSYSGNIKAKKLRKYTGGNESIYAGDRKSRRKTIGGGSISSSWNNKGQPIPGRGEGPGQSSGFTGRMPLSAMPGYGPSKSGVYSGNIRARKLRKYRGGSESTYAGRNKSGKPFKGGGSVSGFWNNKGQPIIGKRGPDLSSGYTGKMPLSAMPGYGPSRAATYSGRIPSGKLRKYSGGNESVYAGRLKTKKPLKGGGSISASWNNKNQPIVGKGPGQYSVGVFSGNMPLSSMPSYGRGKEGTYQGRMKARKPLKGAGGSITRLWNNKNQPIEGKGPGRYDVGRFTGNLPMSALPSYDGSREGSFSGNLKARKPAKGGGGSITRLWNNKNQPIEGKGPGKYDVGRYTGNLPMSALPSYDGSREGSYAGNLKARKPAKGGGGSITRHWNNKGEPIEGKGPGKYDVARYTGNLPLNAMPSYGKGKEGSFQGRMKGTIKKHQSPGTENGRAKTLKFVKLGDPQHGGLSHKEEHLAYKKDLPKELSRKEKLRKADLPGLDRGRSKSLTFLRIGDPQRGGLNYREKNLKYKKDLPGELSRKEKLRIEDAQGLDRGRTRSLSFLKIGDPMHGGLHAEINNTKRKGDLPPEIKGKNRMRLKDSGGLDNGRSKAFTFWAIGEPTKGGLVRNPSQARGRLHPSSSYTASSRSKNSLDEKEQPIKLKIWWAKLFKRNANQPNAVKEKVRRPRYDKNERSIWEMAERPDWYNNK